MKKLPLRAGVILGAGILIVLAYTQGRLDEQAGRGVAFAQVSDAALERATRAFPDRAAYFPNTEELAPD